MTPKAPDALRHNGNPRPDRRSPVMQARDTSRPTQAGSNANPAGGYLLAVAGSAAAVAVAAAAEHWLSPADLSLVFMLAVLIVASRTHTGPAVLTAVLCFLAYNFRI